MTDLFASPLSVVQINLQAHFGGGEVYTAFLCRALSTLGVPTRLMVHPRAGFWRHLDLPTDTVVVPAGTPLSGAPGWVIGHGPLRSGLLEEAKGKGWLATAIAHMPLQGRNPAVFAGHQRVFAVSHWVLSGLATAGLPAWPEPLYGVAEARGGGDPASIRRSSRYDWDRRKLRDRLGAWMEPVIEGLRAHPTYSRRSGLTLGIVSRLTPIKQFPLLFQNLAPALSRVPGINIEIFGAGGYASVRDLRCAVRPIADHVRFWGHQKDVAAVYRGIDYLMTGLPEKEALGLNVIEAQACGTPVLAPNAPPFTETVLDGVTGFLYRDPRTDAGEDFARLLARLGDSARPNPRQAPKFLAQFSFPAFVERLRPVVAWAREAVAT